MTESGDVRTPPPPAASGEVRCLLAAGSALLLRLALVVELARRGLGVAHIVVRGRPVRAIPTPVPGVAALLLPVLHEEFLQCSGRTAHVFGWDRPPCPQGIPPRSRLRSLVRLHGHALRAGLSRSVAVRSRCGALVAAHRHRLRAVALGTAASLLRHRLSLTPFPLSVVS